MISHFNLPDSENSFYFEISDIQREASGLKIAGILGDGSAETWFEAHIGEHLQVCVLPTWEEESDALCQRYDQGLLEEGLRNALEDVRFCSEQTFNPDLSRWQQRIVALAQPTAPPYVLMPRHERPHVHVCETGVVWQRQPPCPLTIASR